MLARRSNLLAFGVVPVFVREAFEASDTLTEFARVLALW